MSLVLVRGGLPARRYFLIRCAVVATCAVLTGLVSAGSARAVLVYGRERPFVGTIPRQGKIVVAKDDGSAPRVIAKGIFPVVAPDGRHVAFFAGNRGGQGLWVTRIDGSHRKRVVRHTAPRAKLRIYNPFVWSPDSRYIVGNIAAPCGPGPASGQCGDNVPVTLVNIARGVVARFTDIALDGAAFSPDSRRFVLGQAPPLSSDPHLVGKLKLASIRRPRHLRFVRSGNEPAWGEPGIAFERPNFVGSGLEGGFDEVDLVATPGGVPRRLFGGPTPNPAVEIVEWANGPGDLLVGVFDRLGNIQPVLIDPRTTAAQYFPQKLKEISAVSRDGSTVLGESLQREVVAVRTDGTVKVLASHADSATWTF